MALRDGYTTGSCATAATMAAIYMATTGSSPGNVHVPLPPFENGIASGSLAVPVESAGHTHTGWFAEVRKDAGDDPDVTHGMIIRADVNANSAPGIEIEGGAGIGRVTMPGLGLPLGAAAINPVPRQQIRLGAILAGGHPGNWRITISAPEGEKRARATLNDKLGIKGGISILGTHGIVRPFSHDAWLACVKKELDVARANSLEQVCLATGRRSAAMLAREYPNLAKHGFIIAGDFAAESLRMARDIRLIAWGCFFGKLAKLALGFENTHANYGQPEPRSLARIADLPDLEQAANMQSMLERLLAAAPTHLKFIVNAAKQNAEVFAGREVVIHLFHLDGRELARA